MTLSNAVQRYIELKQSMGSRFHTEAVILKAGPRTKAGQFFCSGSLTS
jgi:hypothetical protein